MARPVAGPACAPGYIRGDVGWRSEVIGGQIAMLGGFKAELPRRPKNGLNTLNRAIWTVSQMKSRNFTVQHS